jgi:hypothetical protein
MPAIPRRDTTRRTKQVLGRAQGRPWQSYLRSNDLVTNLGFSPVSKLTLTGPMNAEFHPEFIGHGIALTNDDIRGASTVGDLADLVWDKLVEVDP